MVDTANVAALLPAWVAGRSIARALPTPVADHGGYRVDTGSEAERCRWIFAGPCAGLLDLAETIDAPRHWLKWCAPADAVTLPGRWQRDAPCFFMQATAPPPSAALPQGYTLERVRRDGAAAVEVHAGDGSVAASGFGGETDAAFIYDRIVTAPEHRRRGLGRVVMQALRESRRRDDVPELLVATDAGRALYTQIGWRTLAPYSSATIPVPAVAGR